jgi:hypothetical protein
MVSVDIELALVGLVAMLEPATLVSSFLVLVLGRRPLRTGSLFYLGGFGATLAVGVLAAVVLGNAAAAPESSPKTWVSILNVLAGVGILGYVAWALSHPSDPQKTKENIARMRKLDGAPAASIVLAGRAGNWIEHRARTIAMIIATALAVSLLREGIAGLGG